MKVKVLKKFIDKHTREVHKVNTILNISKERYEEIISVDEGLIEVLVEETTTEKKKTTKKATKKVAE